MKERKIKGCADGEWEALKSRPKVAKVQCLSQSGIFKIFWDC